MKFKFLFLMLLTFSCSVEKRLHRPGFHFKKSSIHQRNTLQSEVKKVDYTKNDTNSASLATPIEGMNAMEQLQKKGLPEKDTIKATKRFLNVVNVERKKSIIHQRLIIDRPPNNKKKRERAEKVHQEEESSVLSIIANIFAIMSFVFAILTVLATILSFILSLSLILPLLPAVAALYTSGLSFLFNLFSKSSKYKSRLALIGLITAVIFLTFFILVLAGVIFI